MIKKIVILFVVALSVAGCRKKQLSPVDYVKWVESNENGLKVERELNGFKFKIQYKPSVYIALNETGAGNVEEIERYKKRKVELDSLYYFNFDISATDNKTAVLSHKLNSPEDYYSRINYFTSYAQNDLKLICGDDTIPCSLYHFERTYDLSPYNTIVLGFKAPQGKPLYNADLQLIFEDKILSVGEIRFLITRKTLKNIPQVVL